MLELAFRVLRRIAFRTLSHQVLSHLQGGQDGLSALKAAFQETNLSPANLALPLFIHEGGEDTPIGAMPGCYRLGWRHGLLDEVYRARDVGVNSFVLFPKIPDALKSPTSDEAYTNNRLVPRSIRFLKDKFT